MKKQIIYSEHNNALFGIELENIARCTTLSNYLLRDKEKVGYIYRWQSYGQLHH